MSALDQFNKVVTDFDKDVDFLAVYISEAHPLEGWFVPGGKYNLNQHKSIDDRISSAELLQDAGIACPVVIDTMNNEGINQFAALPEALYVVENGVVKFQGLGPGDEYNPADLRKWLESYVKRS